MSNSMNIDDSCLADLNLHIEEFRNVALAYQEFINLNDPDAANLTAQCGGESQVCETLVSWLLRALTGEIENCDLMEITY